jgi:L-threonylcarbamoyladenylate synthase
MEDSLKRDIKKAVDVLRNGGVVVFPTETAYGMAADATNTEAIKKVFKIKGRRNEFPPPLIASDYKMARRIVEITPLLELFVEKYWPGPLSIKVWPKAGSRLSSWTKRPDGSVAVRVSSNEIARALSKGLNKPIIATSANKHGEPNCYSVSACKKQLKDQVLVPDFVIDIGSIPKRKTSTIVAEENGKIVVYRQGSIRIPKKYVT